MTVRIVRSKISDESYLIQFFGWLDGEPNTMQVVCLSNMFSTPGQQREVGAWIFLEDTEHLRSWLEYGQGKRLMQDESDELP